MKLLHPTTGRCGASACSETRNNSVALMGYDRGENALPVLVVPITECFGSCWTMIPGHGGPIISVHVGPRILPMRNFI